MFYMRVYELCDVTNFYPELRHGLTYTCFLRALWPLRDGAAFRYFTTLN